MKITVVRHWREGECEDTTEVTIDTPCATVDEAIPYAARLAAALATGDEEIADIEVVPTQAGTEASAVRAKDAARTEGDPDSKAARQFAADKLRMGAFFI